MPKGARRPPRANAKRKIEHYTHVGKDRANNPPVGLVTPETDRDAGNKPYAYDPHIDPALQWAGKAERTSFEIPTVSLHVHERIDPRSIIEAVRKKNGEDFVQGSLFSRVDENPPIREAVEFYKHKHNWSNRLIAGDSLLVMNSLLEKEGMAGKVQMVYLDPPYGIEYKSNFQPFLTSRDVKDSDEDLTQEPETTIRPDILRSVAVYYPDMAFDFTVAHLATVNTWLEVDSRGSAIYAPHTSKGFIAPPRKNLLLISNGLFAKYGMWQARRQKAAERLERLAADHDRMP